MLNTLRSGFAIVLFENQSINFFFSFLYFFYYFLKSSKLCIGCRHKIDEGSHKYEGNEWNYRLCTELSPTDAYGKLTFPGSHSKTASV